MQEKATSLAKGSSLSSDSSLFPLMFMDFLVTRIEMTIKIMDVIRTIDDQDDDVSNKATHLISLILSFLFLLSLCALGALDNTVRSLHTIMNT